MLRQNTVRGNLQSRVFKPRCLNCSTRIFIIGADCIQMAHAWKWHGFNKTAADGIIEVIPDVGGWPCSVSWDRLARGVQRKGVVRRKGAIRWKGAVQGSDSAAKNQR